MSLKEQIISDMKFAMRNNTKDVVATLRLLLSEIKNQEIKDKNQYLSESTIISIINKMIKQRNESIDIFQKANRLDLVNLEVIEKNILETYLPQQMSENDMIFLIQESIKNNNATKLSDIGIVMKDIKSKNTGNINMTFVSNKVKERLS